MRCGQCSWLANADASGNCSLAGVLVARLTRQVPRIVCLQHMHSPFLLQHAHLPSHDLVVQGGMATATMVAGAGTVVATGTVAAAMVAAGTVVTGGLSLALQPPPPW
jgi:hypothetical protein